MNLKPYYNLQSTQAIFFIKHTSSLGREEASSSFNTNMTFHVETPRLGLVREVFPNMAIPLDVQRLDLVKEALP